MTLATGAGSLFSTATGVLLIAMGAYIWYAAPRRRENTALAVFTAGWGIVVVAGWIVTPDDPLSTPFWILSSGPIGYAVAAAAVVLARSFGGPEAPHVERRRIWWVAPIAFLLVPYGVVSQASSPLYDSFMPFGTGPPGIWARALLTTGWTAALCSMVLLLALAALRYPRAARERPDAANAILLLTFGVGVYCAQQWANPPDPRVLPPYPGSLMTLTLVFVHIANAMVLLLAVLWLRNVSRAPPPFAARARWAAWVLLVAMLVGLLLDYRDNDWGQLDGVVIGVIRLMAVATLAYAILRTQLLGIDVKVRWGISKSTVAGVFIAVFFIASEGAQEFFGDTLGGTYLGIAAAGALVFAISPLQRAAERLAEKAVPVARSAEPTPEMRRATAGPDPEEAYRSAIRLALRDRRLTRDEEVPLAEIAEALGIGAGRALAILGQVERESRSAAGRGRRAPGSEVPPDGNAAERTAGRR